MSSHNRSPRLALLAGTALAFASIAGIGAAHATSITYQLNTMINGNTLTPTASYGTVTYTDDGNSVDVTIDLADHSMSASQIMMNYNDAKFPISGYSWVVTGDANAIAVSENNEQAGGDTVGKFDIDIGKANGLKGTEPYTFTISLIQNGYPYSSYNLDPTDFAFSAANGLYDAVLLDCDPSWVGSRVTSVPEPTSLAVLGVGMAVLGLRLRRPI